MTVAEAEAATVKEEAKGWERAEGWGAGGVTVAMVN